MDCARSGSPCACQAPAVPPDGPALLVASRTSHTLALVQRTAVGVGATCRRDGATVEVSGDDLPAVLRALDGVLTGPEKSEARALVLTDGFGLGGATIEQALVAPTLGALCAQASQPALAGVLNATSAFHSVYQPIVDLRTGSVVAHEALLRATVGGEPVMPAMLFSTAEAAGWLHVLDRIGRETALRGASGWLGDDSLFVNFNPTSIYRPEVCLATTERAAGEAGLDLRQLVFEVVESHAVRDMEHLQRVLAHYRSRGCRVALDDVGAGYSSLTALAAVQPEVVKLDKELVQALPDRGAVAVVRSVVTLAHEIGATVVAECVETADQAAMATDLGADLAQGWYYGRPVRRTGVDADASTPSLVG